MIKAIVITVAVGSLLLLSWLWRPKQTVERWVWLMLIAFAFLGGWALWFGAYSTNEQEPSGLMFWKPTVMYWTLAIIMLAAPLLGWGYPVKAIFGTFFMFPKKQWRMINWGFAALYVLLGSVNLLYAFNTSEDEWIGFKYACLMNLFFLTLFRINFVWLPTLIDESLNLYGRIKAFFN